MNGHPPVRAIAERMSHITVTDINVNLNFAHTFVRDLVVTLTHPNGSTVATLVNRQGGSGDNLTNTVFDDEATTGPALSIAAIRNAMTPFSSTCICPRTR